MRVHLGIRQSTNLCSQFPVQPYLATDTRQIFARDAVALAFDTAVHLRLTSPKNEHLLWLPDVVSSAYRRTLTHSDRSFFSLIRPLVHLVAPIPEVPEPG